MSCFSYNPNNLSPSSQKLVVWECSLCGIEVNKNFRSAKKNKLCLKCSNKKNANIKLDVRSKKMKAWYKNNEHPLKGTKRPPNVIEGLKKGWNRNKSDKELEYFSKLFTGEGNPMYGKKHSEEALIKMRKAAKKNVRRGKDSNFYGKPPKHGRGEWYTCKDGSKVWMRSRWEIKFAKFLDNLNIEWLYEIKNFPINYNNKEGTYTPDFYLVKKNKYVEIKGWWRDDSKIKYESFKNQYPNIIIVLYDKTILKRLKII